jgi:hypothetical protein
MNLKEIQDAYGKEEKPEKRSRRKFFFLPLIIMFISLMWVINKNFNSEKKVEGSEKVSDPKIKVNNPVIDLLSGNKFSISSNQIHFNFWKHNDENIRKSLINYYGSNIINDPFERGETRLVLSRLKEELPPLSMIDDYRKAFEDSKTKSEQLFFLENLAFISMAGGFEDEAKNLFLKASYLAKENNDLFKQKIYSSISKGEDFDFPLSVDEIEKSLFIPENPVKFTLGLSKIVVSEKDVLAFQEERVMRDWYSMDLNSPLKRESPFLDYHEGGRINDICEITKPSLKPITGIIAIKKNNKWYASDENGILRFEVLLDKVEYPTTKIWDKFAFIVDTHGLSSMVSQSLSEKATVVVGCGDYKDKMIAADYLSQKGVSAYFPCDRFVSEVIGYKGKGVLIGTAPINKDNQNAVIGNQPVTIFLDEVIVVQDITKDYPAQYYDAPKRYFDSLQKISGIKMKVRTVKVNDLEESYLVVNKAEEINARVIAVRVAYEKDYLAVSNWLKKSKNNRAILFHSAAYDWGYRLFKEFPVQTSFGDPKPLFQ